MSPARQALPAYLKKHIGTQEYDSYTPQDHAAWRYIMRQNRAFLENHAVPVYLEGLKKTGISLERIPRVSEMDERLAQFGWGAVPVEGFIPPSAFLDFQSRGVLPIACDMRTVNHIAYTPAPDIVHEAAGHAPILADPQYGRYLHRYAAMARKAIVSLEDIRHYEAIRYLSDIKENPDATKTQILEAEERLIEVTRSLVQVSEAARVARMNWWTVEYGLLGDPRSPRIYGAGLLSSVGESQHCLSDKVKKIPLSVDCVETAYNITEPQPQLFVARDMDHLVEVLETFEATLSCRTGGIAGLKEAKKACTVTTSRLDSGLEISGVLSDFLADGNHAQFIRYSGPVQLAFESNQLTGHGRERHPNGFSSPLSALRSAPSKPTNHLTDTDLKGLGLEKGKSGTLEFQSGFKVQGKLAGIVRQEEQLILLTWHDCRVWRGSETFFEPSWGEFDMAVGDAITSVYGGPADRAEYGALELGTACSSPRRKSPYTQKELAIFGAFKELRRLREEKKSAQDPSFVALAEKASRELAGDWLIQLELFELAVQLRAPEWIAQIEKTLDRLEKGSSPVQHDLIRKGRGLARG